MGRKRCESVSEAVDELHPVLFMKGFSNTAFEGAKIANCDLRYVDDVVIGVEKWVSYWTDIITACLRHLSHQTIGGGTYDLSIHLSCRKHIADMRGAQSLEQSWQQATGKYEDTYPMNTLCATFPLSKSSSAYTLTMVPSSSPRAKT